MSLTLRNEGILTALVPGGNRYILPERRGRPLRAAGLALAGFGMLATSFMVFWMSGPIRGAFTAPPPMRWFMLLFGLTGVLGLVPALGMLIMGLGLALGRSHCEIELSAGRLRLSERVGPFGWTWTRRAGDVRRLVLQDGATAGKDGSAPIPPALAGTYGCIVAAGATNRRNLFLGCGYPLALLRPLADRLAEDLSVAGADARDARSRGDTVPVLDSEQARADARSEWLDHPPETDILLRLLPDGVALSVPPAGLWRGSHGLFAFAILWNSFIGVFAAVLVGSILRGKGRGDAPPALAALFLVPFVAVGVGVLLAAVNMGRRRVLLAVTGGALTVRSIGPLKVRETRLAVSDVTAIRVGPSGMSVNDRPIMELQIVPRDGKKIGLLSQRSEDELRWIDAVLRQAAGMV